MKWYQLSLWLILVVFTQGCSVTNSSTPAALSNVYLDQHFEFSGKIESEQDIFSISPAMQHYVRSRLLNKEGTRIKTKILINDLFSEKYMNIEYSPHANFTPAETFEKGLANCMSLTLLSYVLINEAGLDGRFMSVSLEENWTVSPQATLLNGHVNLEVRPLAASGEVVYQAAEGYVIDFLPMLNNKIGAKKSLSKSQIIALFYNNKAADALADRDYTLAYQYLKQATLSAPNLASVWGNLASLYRQTGHIQQAENLYHHALSMAPNNLTIQENLALLYKLTGRSEQAQKIYTKGTRCQKKQSLLLRYASRGSFTSKQC